VSELTRGTERVIAGDLDTRVEVVTGDEFEDLATSFNQMVGRVSGLLEELNDLNIGTIRALASAIDAKSQWTAGHSERVTRLTVKLGRELGLTEDELETLERGAILHDVGKIAVPQNVLDKDGPLDEAEWETMRSHAERGVQIVQHIPQYAALLPIIRQHHERWDGTGYPDGLRGDEIDPWARILAVADTFDAMTSDRPYRNGLPVATALDVIRKERGIGFEPRVVDAFLGLHVDQIDTAVVLPLERAAPRALAEEVRRMA